MFLLCELFFVPITAPLNSCCFCYCSFLPICVLVVQTSSTPPLLYHHVGIFCFLFQKWTPPLPPPPLSVHLLLLIFCVILFFQLIFTSSLFPLLWLLYFLLLFLHTYAICSQWYACMFACMHLSGYVCEEKEKFFIVAVNIVDAVVVERSIWLVELEFFLDSGGFIFSILFLQFFFAIFLFCIWFLWMSFIRIFQLALPYTKVVLRLSVDALMIYRWNAYFSRIRIPQRLIVKFCNKNGWFC